MSAYSEAANGFVVSDRVTLMLNTMSDEARTRILARAYAMFFDLGGSPLVEVREEAAAKAVAQCATEIHAAFKRRQKQSQSARQVGASRAEGISRPSHDNREIRQEERRDEKGSPIPPIKEESKEEDKPTPPKPPSRSEFVKPAVEEVAAYCKARGNTVDPHTFVDFYESKGWCIGKNKMKDWQAAVRTWERSRDGATTGTGHAGFTPRRCASTATAGNFRTGTTDQRAEAASVL